MYIRRIKVKMRVGFGTCHVWLRENAGDSAAARVMGIDDQGVAGATEHGSSLTKLAIKRPAVMLLLQAEKETMLIRLSVVKCCRN